MTTLGHSLTGLALLTLIIPRGLSWLRRILWCIVYISLASIPDWPLPIWGHQQLAISHSLWVNLIICLTLATLLWRWFPNPLRNYAIFLTALCAWMSHLFLDALYGNLPGVAIYWPLSDGLASLPLPWLKTLPHPPPPFDSQVIHILFFEFMTFSPLILIAYAIRCMWLNRR